MSILKNSRKPAKKNIRQAKLQVEALVSDDGRAELKNAVVVFRQTVDAVENFHKTYLDLRSNRTEEPTHGEQDLLRAMLVFACSGLDAVVKQLLHDSLAAVIDNDLGAEKEFEKFVERKFRKTNLQDDKDKSGSATIDAAMLSSAITSRDPRSFLVGTLRRTLTGDSLQSTDQLLRVAAHFAITKDEVLPANTDAKDGFKAHNEIIHEMDVDFLPSTKQKSERRIRQYGTFKKYSENTLSTAARFINAVSKKLSKPSTEIADDLIGKMRRTKAN